MNMKLFETDSESSASEQAADSFEEAEDNNQIETSGSNSDDNKSLIDEPVNNVNGQQYIAKNSRLWVQDPPYLGRALQANLVRDRARLTVQSRNLHSLEQMFKLIITEEIVEIIVQETNRKVIDSIDNYNLNNPNAEKNWNQTDSLEIYTFIGLLILARVYRSMNENINELWSKANGRPIFSATMPVRRFKDLLRFCRFNNFLTRDIRNNVDKLAPIRNIWSIFLQQLRLLYIPSESLIIDEQFVFTRGRCGLNNIFLLNRENMELRFFGCAMLQPHINFLVRSMSYEHQMLMQTILEQN